MSAVTVMQNDCCCICLESFVDKYNIVLTCNHMFHLSCINSWKNTCPLCRANFKLPSPPPPQQIYNLYNQELCQDIYRELQKWQELYNSVEPGDPNSHIDNSHLDSIVILLSFLALIFSLILMLKCFTKIIF
jgi:flagellar biosynthesis protein FliP